jgi:acyl-CoA synthetase (AMP-forming)/AMP-acid ligase II
MRTLVELIRYRATERGEATVHTFLADGERDEQTLTFAQLERSCRRVGALLQTIPGRGERALLLYEPGLHYIIGFFGTQFGGWIPVPAYPPNPTRLARTLPRIRGIIANSRPRVVLTTSNILPLARAMLAQLPECADVQVLATDEIPDDVAEHWRDPELAGEDLAWLQYTSGSTGNPKGVMVSHRNILHNQQLSGDVAAIGERLRMACWLPPYHDMGLIGGIIYPITTGGHSTLMASHHFLARPLRWLHAATRARANQLVGPNFAFKLCVRKVTPAELERIDLSPVEMVWNGAEPIRHEVLAEFAATFGRCGFRHEAFYPCYGLAEATLFVSGGERTAAPVVREFSLAGLERMEALAPAHEDDTCTLVGCGHARPGTEIRIVDPDTLATLPNRRVGEIWVRSDSVAHGYWGMADESHANFEAHTAERDGPFLRTGDLGFLDERELHVTGRIKDLLIIRGRNLYPNDIEDTVATADPAIRPGCVAAFSIERDGEERLVIVGELHRTEQPPDGLALVRAVIAAVVSAHEVRPAIVQLLDKGEVPKTPSGKLQRRLCKAMLGAGELRPIVAWDERDLQC